MKKIITLLALSLAFATSMFAINFTVGGNFNLGGTLSDDAKYHGLSTGTGAFFNMDMFLGLGLQAEVNVSEDYITVGDKSLTFDERYGIVDTSIMAWWNAKLGPIGLGLGVGPNFSGTISDYEKASELENNNLVVGIAAGANTIFYIGNHFGIVAGVHGVFDFTPRFTVDTDKSQKGQTTISWDTSEWERRSIYGTIGAEYRF